MKKTILTLALSIGLLASSAISQILITTPTDLTTNLSGTTYLVEKESTEFLVYAGFRLVNNSGSTETLRFRRLRTVDSGLTDQLCYDVECTNAGDVTDYVWADNVVLADGQDIEFKPQIININEESFMATHTYEVMDANFLVLAAITVQFNVGDVANLDVLTNEFKKTSVYPNPAKDVLTISTSKNTDVDVMITDALGKEVFRKNNFTSNTINISNFNNGVYFVRIYNSELQLSETRKLIIKK